MFLGQEIITKVSGVKVAPQQSSKMSRFKFVQGTIDITVNHISPNALPRMTSLVFGGEL